MSTVLGEAIVKFAADTSGLKSGISSAKSEIASMSETASSTSHSVVSSFGGMVGGLVDFGAKIGQTVFGLQSLAQGAIGLGKSLLGPAAAAEQVEGSLEIFTGSAKRAREEMQALSDFAAHTPFETSSIDQAALKLQSVGINAKDVIPYIRALGDGLDAAGRTSSADLAQLSDSFIKIQTQGHLTTDVMDSFAASGIDAWSVLEKQTGKTHAQLADMISKGLYPAKQAMNDLTTGIEKNPLYKGQMANDANVFNGALSTLTSTWDQALASFGSPIIKGLEPVLQGITSQLSSKAFQDFATGAGKKVGDVIGFLADKATHALPSFKDIGSALGEVGNFISDDLLPPATEIVDVAGQIIDNFITWNDKTHFLQNTLQDVGGFVRGVADDVATKLMPPVRDAISAFQEWLAKSGFVHDSLGLLGGVIDKTSGFVGGLVKGLADVFGWFGQNKQQADLLKDAIFAIGGVIAGVKIVKFGEDVFTTFSTAKKNVTDFVDAVGKIKDKAGDVLKFFQETFQPQTKTALDGVSKSADGVATSTSGIGKKALVSEAQVAEASAAEDVEVASVGLAADGTALGIKGIGVAALGAIGSLSAIAAVAFGLFETAKWLRDNNIIPMGSQSQPNWVTHNNLQDNGDWYTHYHHASGIMNSPTTHVAMVGERGPELMVVPKGANIYPHGVYPSSMPVAAPLQGNSGGTVKQEIHNHFYVNGREVAYEIVDDIGNAMVDRIRSEGHAA